MTAVDRLKAEPNGNDSLRIYDEEELLINIYYNHLVETSLSRLKMNVSKSIQNLKEAISGVAEQFHLRHLNINNNNNNTNNNSNKPKNCLQVLVVTWNMKGQVPMEDLSSLFARHDGINNKTPDGSSKGSTESVTEPYHVIVVGTQECARSIEKSVLFNSKEAWEKRLRHYLGKEYFMAKTHTMNACHLAVFVLRPYTKLIRNIQCDSVATGIANMIGNKGGIGISFKFGDASFLFINCHLTAHQDRVPERNMDVKRICEELRLWGYSAKDKLHKNADERFDYVFFFGDTNYRVNGTRNMIDVLIEQGRTEVLLANDQLSIERRKNRVFKGYEEAPITFFPTYKFEAGNGNYAIDQDDDLRQSVELRHSTDSALVQSPLPSTQPFSPRKSIDAGKDLKKKRRLTVPGSPNSFYDASKKARVPSWTDRILYKTRVSMPSRKASEKSNSTMALANLNANANVPGGVEPISVLQYSSLMNMMSSDHKPVYGVFRFNYCFVDDYLENLNKKEKMKGSQNPHLGRRRSSRETAMSLPVTSCCWGCFTSQHQIAPAQGDATGSMDKLAKSMDSLHVNSSSKPKDVSAAAVVEKSAIMDAEKSTAQGPSKKIGNQ